MPTAAASSRWFAVDHVFNASRTCQVGSEPPAAASAASNARLTAHEVLVSCRPIGGPGDTWPDGPSRLAGHLGEVVHVADELGLDTVWVPDHLLQGAPGTSPEDEMPGAPYARVPRCPVTPGAPGHGGHRRDLRPPPGPFGHRHC
ncbi:hypothetical protein ABZV93_00015 [Actinopolymorpha sp. NPDC004070]|uniref:hypothetical protein n=1 Tax=Actinopolymorpha sp. NPDC004070 TaxID=3154548 RepID=UPI0033A76052